MSVEISEKKIRQKPSSVQTGFLIVTALIFFIMIYFGTGLQKTVINPTEKTHIYFMGELSERVATIKENQVYLPLSFLKDKVDANIKLDEKNKLVILTTSEQVFHMPLGNTKGFLNLEPYEFTYPVIQQDGEIYLPATPLDSYYNFHFKWDKEQKIVIIHDLNLPLQEGIVLQRARLRTEPSIRAPWLSQLNSQETVSITREENGWYWVETANGVLGFIDKDSVKLTQIKFNPIVKNFFQPWNPIGQPISLVWDYFGNYRTKEIDIHNKEAVNVLSPTWFELQENGLIKNLADKSYVERAHANNMKVWGLFSNSFNKDLTHEFLEDAILRMSAIKQILTFVDMYQLDGINIDFENMHLKDKAGFVQFIRELTPLLHEKGRIISIDVTFISKSENWSLCYDREALSKIADYIIVMAYDENGTFSSRPGSVSSLPWVEKGIQQILREVPNDKLILGVPFYSRLWKEVNVTNGNIALSSMAVSMNKAEEWIKEQKVEISYDQKSGQNYAEKTIDNATYKIWLEDEVSMQKRIELMKKYSLAGIGAWKKGFEKDEMWNFIYQELNK